MTLTAPAAAEGAASEDEKSAAGGLGAVGSRARRPVFRSAPGLASRARSRTGRFRKLSTSASIPSPEPRLSVTLAVILSADSPKVDRDEKNQQGS
jgi:hypothetical protein